MHFIDYNPSCTLIVPKHFWCYLLFFEVGLGQACQNYINGPRCRDRQAECSSLFPVLAASATRATQLLFSILPPFGRMGRGTKDLLQGLLSLRELRAGNLARSLLIVVFSVLALVLSYAGLSMDKAIAGKLNQLNHQSGKILLPANTML